MRTRRGPLGRNDCPKMSGRKRASERRKKKKKVFYSFSQKYWICSNKHNHFWYKPEGATFSYQMMRDVVVNKYSSFQLPECNIWSVLKHFGFGYSLKMRTSYSYPQKLWNVKCHPQAAEDLLLPLTAVLAEKGGALGQHCFALQN